MLLIDTNLLILLVVGMTNPDYIVDHRRLQGYTSAHFDTLFGYLASTDDIMVTPHILAEVSNLTDQPFRRDIRRTFLGLIDVATELHVDALSVVEHPVFEHMGLTDAAICHICTGLDDPPTLLTADKQLANYVRAHGGRVQDFPQPIPAR